MNLIVIYGPPGAGKLTIANELAFMLDYKVLHIHLVMDLVTSLFPRGTKSCSRLSRHIRLELIKAAAQEGLKGIVFTYGYASPTADEFIKDLMDLCKTYHVGLHFVHITCSLEELKKRVEEPSRKGTGKIQSKEELVDALSKMTFGIIPYVDNLIIDNTNLSAEEVAEQIIEYYKLG